MGSSAVRRDVEALTLEERVSLHAPVLVGRAHHGVPELHDSTETRPQRRRFGRRKRFGGLVTAVVRLVLSLCKPPPSLVKLCKAPSTNFNFNSAPSGYFLSKLFLEMLNHKKKRSIAIETR